MASSGLLTLLCAVLLSAAAPINGRELQQSGFYIFGYGSLLYDVSRIKTNCGLSGISEAGIGALLTIFTKSGDTTNKVFIENCDNKGIRPVRVAGVKRGWYAPGTFSGGLGQALKDSKFAPSAFGIVPTYLGAVKNDKSTVTGLIYEVTQAQFDAVVVRETAAGYTLVELPLSVITVLDGGAPLTGKVAFFANTPDQVEKPSKRKPICSSYVDVWLAGAIKIQQQWNLTGPDYKKNSPVKALDFVSETIITTDAWRPFWVNDRYPVYRPFVNMPFANTIDQALYANVNKNVLRKIKFPGQP